MTIVGGPDGTCTRVGYRRGGTGHEIGHGEDRGGEGERGEDGAENHGWGVMNVGGVQRIIWGASRERGRGRRGGQTRAARKEWSNEEREFIDGENGWFPKGEKL